MNNRFLYEPGHKVWYTGKLDSHGDKIKLKAIILEYHPSEENKLLQLKIQIEHSSEIISCALYAVSPREKIELDYREVILIPDANSYQYLVGKNLGEIIVVPTFNVGEKINCISIHGSFVGIVTDITVDSDSKSFIYKVEEDSVHKKEYSLDFFDLRKLS